MKKYWLDVKIDVTENIKYNGGWNSYLYRKNIINFEPV